MKLHLGCGQRYLAGYTHCDVSKYPHIDHVGPVEDLPWCPDSSVELIYASHIFEYFTLDKAHTVLLEWKRVLQPGGVLRLAVPDFEALTMVYLKTRQLELVRGPIYGHWETTTGKIQHATVYDKRTLTLAFVGAGFTNIHLWDWRQVFVDELQDFDDYSQAYIPHMAKERGTLISLNMQGAKPSIL